MRHGTTLLGMACTMGMALVGCSSSDTTPSGTTTTGVGGSGGAGGGGPTPVCTDPGRVPCSDQVILGMNLQADPAPGLIANVADGEGWYSLVDATAGGAFNPNPHSFVYGKFTDTGLVKVDISDEASLDSMDWDIAFRRYVVRINSGNSGPSCVTAARLPGNAARLRRRHGRARRAHLQRRRVLHRGTGLHPHPRRHRAARLAGDGARRATGRTRAA